MHLSFSSSDYIYAQIRCVCVCLDLLSGVAELKECDPVFHSLAHLGSSGVGEGHQEHHRGPGLRVLLQCRERLEGRTERGHDHNTGT